MIIPAGGTAFGGRTREMWNCRRFSQRYAEAGNGQRPVPQIATLGWALRRAAWGLLVLAVIVWWGPGCFTPVSIRTRPPRAAPPNPSEAGAGNELGGSRIDRRSPSRGHLARFAPALDLVYQGAMQILSGGMQGGCGHDHMKLVMLARNPSLYSHRRIVEAARRARPRDRRDQYAARAHEHHVQPADALARRALLPHTMPSSRASAPRSRTTAWPCCGSSRCRASSR